MSANACLYTLKHDVREERIKHGVALVCLDCRKLIGYTGQTLTDERLKEIENFVLVHGGRDNKRPTAGAKQQEGNNSMKNMTATLTAAHLNGLKSAVHALEVQITILKTLLKGKASKATEADDESGADGEEEEDEKPAPKKGKKAAKASKSFEDDEEEEDAEESDDEEDEEEEDEKPAKKGKGKKASKSFEDDEDEEDEGAEESDEEEDEKPAPKKGKGKKVTVDDVNDACMERAGRTDRKEVLALLKKSPASPTLNPPSMKSASKPCRANKNEAAAQ